MASKVAFVTGASRGIGKAICAHLALRGYDIVVTSRSIQPRDVTPFPGTIGETAALVESLGARALAVRCDVGKEGDLHRAVGEALDRFGRIDLLVNNARHEGPYFWNWLIDIPPEDIPVAVACNLVAPLVLTRLVLPGMIERGGGMIVNVTSGTIREPRTQPPGGGRTGLIYPMTKTGLDAFTFGLVPEVRQHNITIVSLQPGRTLIERPTGGGADYYGTNLATRHTVHVPAVAVDYLVTCERPLEFTGQVINAPDFVRERNLMAPGDITTPFKEGEIYDPYAEPFWQRLLERMKR